MEVFYREETRKTPKISFDPKSGYFEITGRSYSENSFEFFEELFEWLNGYLEVPLSSTNLKFNLDYFNTSSFRCFVQLIKKLEKIHDKNHEITIIWEYDPEDEETREAGEALKEVTALPLKVEKVYQNVPNARK